MGSSVCAGWLACLVVLHAGRSRSGRRRAGPGGIGGRERERHRPRPRAWAVRLHAVREPNRRGRRRSLRNRPWRSLGGDPARARTERRRDRPGLGRSRKAARRGSRRFVPGSTSWPSTPRGLDAPSRLTCAGVRGPSSTRASPTSPPARGGGRVDARQATRKGLRRAPFAGPLGEGGRSFPNATVTRNAPRLALLNSRG